MSKQAIMEVILSGDNTLTQQQISWAIANIPNDENARQCLPFNHDADDMFTACGLSESIDDCLGKEYAKLRAAAPGDRKSQFIEYLEANASPQMMRSLLIRGVQSVEDKAEKMVGDMSDEMKQLLDLLKKLK